MFFVVRCCVFFLWGERAISRFSHAIFTRMVLNYSHDTETIIYERFRSKKILWLCICVCVTGRYSSIHSQSHTHLKTGVSQFFCCCFFVFAERLEKYFLSLSVFKIEVRIFLNTTMSTMSWSMLIQQTFFICRRRNADTISVLISAAPVHDQNHMYILYRYTRSTISHHKIDEKKCAHARKK